MSQDVIEIEGEIYDPVSDSGRLSVIGGGAQVKITIEVL